MSRHADRTRSHRHGTSRARWTGAVVVLALVGVSPGAAHAFSSGSTGADGPFAPSCSPTPCTVTVPVPASGIFNSTTVTIPADVTVTLTPNATNTPVSILATGEVTIASNGVLSLDGQPGSLGSSAGPIIRAGGAGGPGGFPGGQGGAKGTTDKLASGGQGPGGGGIATPGACGIAGTYGAPAELTNLIPLFGGSGGGGGESFNPGTSGSAGAGGGGAVVLASSTRITVHGVIRANGGNSADFFILGSGGAGSGGAIRLVAPEIAGTGFLEARTGSPFTCLAGGPGRIRLESPVRTFTGSTNPPASVSDTMGPVTAASTPPLVTLPTLRFSAIAGAGVPVNPGSAYTTADVIIPAQTVNPVPVLLTATHIPVGTVFTVRLLPPSGGTTSVNAAPSTGTVALSTATVQVTLPTGQISVLHASAAFTLPQLASLLPLIDGEPVERIMVAAEYGGPSTLTLVTRSGKEIRADQLPSETQLKLAVAFAALNDQATR